MKRIGIISDTHGTFDGKLREFLRDVDEIWHAGDIGSLGLADEIAAFKPCAPSRATSTADSRAGSIPTSRSSGARRSAC